MVLSWLVGFPFFVVFVWFTFGLFLEEYCEFPFGELACAAFRTMQEEGDCAWITKENRV